jgi:Flp pilus assembly protein TadD
MAEPRRCNRCGNPLRSDAPAGRCPVCMLRGGLDASREDMTFSFEPTQPGHVLESLARSIGPIPTVLLPDTASDDAGVAVIKPSSDEMPAPGERGDRYQLFGEIARGGMGAVLKGRDPDLGRDLAVKVLLESHHDKPELVRRFVEEAQIGGQLQHPGIVPVYELGAFADRRPYFTMKLVKGRTLSALLAERQSTADDLFRFLGIFEAVCQTLAYAHARGVIHRDLKPSNVMVGSFGEVQVMDWGLAKVLKEGGAADEPAVQPSPGVSVIATVRSGSDVDDSQAGSVLGTPAYMAPEQAAGEVASVGRRADVFGLGSVLCEILSGAPAYTGRGSAEILRKAMRGDTADALSRLNACGAESELIALAKDCLAIEPEDRPRDGVAVAERVTAYLAGVQARVQAAERERAVAVARAIEERRRRKLQVGLAAAVLAFTTLGGLSTTYYLQQRTARAAAIDRIIGQAVTLREQAAAQPEDLSRWQVALAAVEQADAGDDGTAQERLLALHSEIKDGLDAAERDRELLDRLVDIRSAEADDEHGSATDAAYAHAFREAGIDFASLGPPMAGARIRARPESVALALAAALDDWAASSRRKRKDMNGSARLAEAARVADPDPWRSELRRVLDESDAPARLAGLQALAKTAKFDELGPISLHLLGSELYNAGDRASALSVLRTAQQHHPRDLWVTYELGRVLENLSRRDEAICFYTAARSIRPETAHVLAHALAHRGDSDEAIAVFRDLMNLRPHDAGNLGCLGRALMQKGLTREAGEMLERAVAAGRARIDERPDDGGAHYTLGLDLEAQGKLGEAIAEFRTATRLTPDLAEFHTALGIALRDQGKPDEAIAEFRTAIRLKPDSLAHEYLGRSLALEGKLEEAIAELRTAIRLKPDSSRAHAILGYALRRQGKLDLAAAEYRAAIRLEPDAPEAHYNLGIILCDSLGDYPAAESEFRTALRLKPDWFQAHCNLGLALARQGKLDLAIAEYHTAIRLNPDDAQSHDDLGRALFRQGKLGEAISEHRTAVRLKPDDPHAHGSLGVALARQGKLDEAIASYRTAIRLNPGDLEFHNNLGSALAAQGKLDLAIVEYRTAIQLKPDALAHYNLGIALKSRGNFDLAIAEYRTAIGLKPDYAEPHCNLGQIFTQRGEFSQALEMYRKGHELGSRRPDWPYPSAQWVADAERKLDQANRFPAVLRGDDKPKDNSERRGFAQMAYDRKHFVAASRLWAAALEADPKLVDDRQNPLRYESARAAALAIAGHGKDEPPPDDVMKAKLRSQALEWLKGELTTWTKVLESGPSQTRAKIVQTLNHWKKDSDLAGVRDALALARLPEEERKTWQELWADVDSLLNRAAGQKQ